MRGGVLTCSDPAQVAWARSFLALLAALAAYVKAFHTTGLAWNARGVPVEQYEAARAAPDAGAAAAGGALPAPPAPPAAPPAPPAPPAAPPAPPAPAPPAAGGAPAAAPVSGMDAVFGQINQGEGITRSLRHVDKNEQTHKKPALRRDAPAATTAAAAGGATAAGGAAAAVAKRPASKKLDGNKWTIVRAARLIAGELCAGADCRGAHRAEPHGEHLPLRRVCGGSEGQGECGVARYVAWADAQWGARRRRCCSTHWCRRWR